MSLPLHYVKLAPADRILWRRALDELLIDAIFGDLPPVEEEALIQKDAADALTPRLLVAAE